MTKGQTTIILEKNAEIWKELAKNPQGFMNLKTDREIYIDVRKNNTLDAYYRGQKVVEIEPTLAIDTYDHKKIIKKKREIDAKKLKPENVLKSKFILESCDKDSFFIDSEFEYTLLGNKTARADLVYFHKGCIYFVELKRYKDRRLAHRNSKPIEVVKQMQKYRDVFKELTNNGVLKKYYQTVATIKYRLGLISDEIEIIGINEIPILLIADIPPIAKGRPESSIRRKLDSIKKKIEDFPMVERKEGDFSFSIE
ncbi:MAG: hypothetical protein LBN20_00875 [Endomicrobium sp.]|jgi:hypothetical protein|nr:hypothetical protein [Endomicrobium sp.]